MSNNNTFSSLLSLYKRGSAGCGIDNTSSSIITLFQEKGISDFEIGMLDAVFGEDYFHKNKDSIIQRRQKASSLIGDINRYNDYSGRTLLIREWAVQNFDEPYNKQLHFYGDDYKEQFEKMNNKIVIDLFSRGNIDLLEIQGDNNDYVLQPSHLIYIDICNKNTVETIQRGDNHIHTYKIQDDVLEFLSILPDNSVNYIISGVDMYLVSSCIANPDSIVGQKYLGYLNREIYRTMAKNSIVLGVNYEFRQGLRDMGCKVHHDDESHFKTFYCYEK